MINRLEMNWRKRVNFRSHRTHNRSTWSKKCSGSWFSRQNACSSSKTWQILRKSNAQDANFLEFLFFYVFVFFMFFGAPSVVGGWKFDSRQISTSRIYFFVRIGASATKILRKVRTTVRPTVRPTGRRHARSAKNIFYFDVKNAQRRVPIWQYTAVL